MRIDYSKWDNLDSDDEKEIQIETLSEEREKLMIEFVPIKQDADAAFNIAESTGEEEEEEEEEGKGKDKDNYVMISSSNKDNTIDFSSLPSSNSSTGTGTGTGTGGAGDTIDSKGAARKERSSSYIHAIQLYQQVINGMEFFANKLITSSNKKNKNTVTTNTESSLIDMVEEDHNKSVLSFIMSCHLNIAAANIKLHRYETAITHCRKGLKYDRKNGKAYHFQGYAEMKLHQTERACQSLKYAVDLLAGDVITGDNKKRDSSMYERVIDDYHEAMEILKAKKQDNSSSYSMYKTLLVKGKEEIKKGNFSSGEEKLQNIINYANNYAKVEQKQEKNVSFNSLVLGLQSSRELGILYLRKKEFEKAIHFFLYGSKFADLAVYNNKNNNNNNNNCFEVGILHADCLHQCGSIYYKTKEFTKAIDTYERGIQVLKLAHTSTSESDTSSNDENGNEIRKYRDQLYAHLHSDLGIALVNQKLYVKAMEPLEKGHKALKELINVSEIQMKLFSKENKEEMQSKMNNNNNNTMMTTMTIHLQSYKQRYLYVMEGLSDVYACSSKWESALQAGDEAIKIAKQLGAKERITKTLFSQGVIASKRPHLSVKETCLYWCQATDIYEELGKRVKAADLHIDIGERALKGAGGCLLTGKFPSIQEADLVEFALEHYEKAISLLRNERQKLQKESTSTMKIMGIQFDKMICMALLGSAFAQKDPIDAFDGFTKLIHHMHRVLPNDRDDIWNSKYGEYSYYAAVAAGRCKKYDTVVHMLEQSLKFYRKAYDKKGIKDALEGLGVFYNRKGEMEKSQECFLEAIDIQKKTVSNSNSNSNSNLSNNQTAEEYETKLNELLGKWRVTNLKKTDDCWNMNSNSNTIQKQKQKQKQNKINNDLKIEHLDLDDDDDDNVLQDNNNSIDIVQPNKKNN